MIITDFKKTFICNLCIEQIEILKKYSHIFNKKELTFWNELLEKIKSTEELDEIFLTVQESDALLDHCVSLTKIFTSVRQCPKCDNFVMETSRFCAYCGNEFKFKGKLCTNQNCSNLNDIDAIYCKFCGSKLEE